MDDGSVVEGSVVQDGVVEAAPAATPPSLGAGVTTRHRLRQLLDAVALVGSDLDLDATLRRLTDVAVDLVDATYGALGVLDPAGGLQQFLVVGLDPVVRARMGPLPTGRGLLGELITHPRTLRLTELGQHPSSVGFPPDHPPMHSFLGTPIRAGNTVYGNLYLTEKRGGAQFSTEDEEVLEALAATAGIAIENAELFARGELRQRWLEASADIRAEMMSGATDSDAMQLVAQRIRELVDADLVLVLLAHQGPLGSYTVAAQSGVSETSELVGSEIDPTHPLLRPVVLDGAPAHLDRLATDARPMTPALGGPGPALVVPMSVGDKPVGVVLARRGDDRRDFQPPDVPVAVELGEVGALALELSRLNRGQQRLVVLADRDRIAQDLHDQVIQRLFATGLQLEGTARRTDDPVVTRRLESAVRDLDTTIAEIRAAIFDLQSPQDAAGLGLRQTLLAIVDETAAESSVVVSVQFVGPVDSSVAAAVAAHVCAVVREAVSNAVRHARATSVSVTISVVDATLSVQVRDDGDGIDPGVARSGLANLENRARTLDGTLEIGPGRTSGTCLTWRVPLY
ncbi:MAG: GAF domain-containing protein [Mycobacteriaceae bacterium]